MMWYFDFWHWGIIGIIFFIIEILVPGAFIMWLGIGAIGVSIIEGIAQLLNIKFSLGAQGIMFAILSIIATLVGKNFYKIHAKTDAPNNLNRRGEQYIGRVITLSADIIDNRGHVRIDDTQWTVKGANYRSGAIVRIIGVQGALLIVEQIK